jgi:uncharacterized membrane protein YphA (DoxX/SURF4 family)
MFKDTTCHSLAMLILRLALGVIFIYHGANKLSPVNEWGAEWATNRWLKEGQAPHGLQEKVEAIPHMSDERKKEVWNQLAIVYGKESRTNLPGSLETHAAQLAVAWGEFLGGIALLVGLLTRLAAAGEIIIQVGAIFSVTAYRGFSLERGGGAEYNLALVAMCLALLVMGGGAWAVDSLFVHPRKKSAQQPAAQAAVEQPVG